MIPRTQPWKPPRLAHGAPVALITERQADVLTDVCTGLTNPEIGRKRYLTEDTVKTHIRRLLAEFGVANRGHLASLAMSGQIAVLVREWS